MSSNACVGTHEAHIVDSAAYSEKSCMLSKMKEPTCETKTKLLVAHQNTTEFYAKAVSELARKTGVVSRIQYEKLSLAAERARKLSFEARELFEGHIAEHGC
jgi:hypothetical protein